MEALLHTPISFWAPSLIDPLRPPVKARGGVDDRWLLLQSSTARQLDLLEFLDAGEMLVDKHLIGQRPRMLRRLQLRGIGRQEQQMHMLGYSQTQVGMPTGPVQHQYDLLLWASSVALMQSESGYRLLITVSAQQLSMYFLRWPSFLEVSSLSCYTCR